MPKRSAQGEAEAFLREALVRGPRPAREVLGAARQAGVAERTLKRARAALGVGAARQGGLGKDGAWVWAITSRGAVTRLRGPNPPKGAKGDHLALLGEVGPLSTAPGATQARALGVEGAAKPLAAGRIPRQRVTVRVSRLKYKPELFQARDVDPGAAFSEKRVGQLVEGFDWALFTAPSAVPDPGVAGDLIVYCGHHRTEACRRRFGEEALIEVIVVEADIRDPAQLRALRLEGDASNFTTAAPNLRETVRAVRRLEEAGLQRSEIAARLRKSVSRVQEIQDAARLGSAAIDRVTQEPALESLASELGRGMRVYGMREDNAVAWFKRLAVARRGERSTAGALRETIRAFGPRLAEVPQAMFDVEALGGEGGGGILGLMDLHARRLAELERAVRRQKQVQRRLTELEASPSARKADKGALRRSVEVAAKEQARLEGELEANRGDVLRAWRAVQEGRTTPGGRGVRPGGRERPCGARTTGGVPALGQDRAAGGHDSPRAGGGAGAAREAGGPR